MHILLYGRSKTSAQRGDTRAMKKRTLISTIFLIVLLCSSNVISYIYMRDKLNSKQDILVAAYDKVTVQNKEIKSLKSTEQDYLELVKEHTQLAQSQQSLEDENKTLSKEYQELTTQIESLKLDREELEQKFNDLNTIIRQYSYVFQYDPATLEECQIYIQELEEKVLEQGSFDKFEKPKRWRDYGDIVIWLEDGASVKWSEKAISYLRMLPQKILETLNEEGWMLIITPRNLEDVYESGVSNTVGLTIYYQARIYIQNDSFSISYCTIHEVGHALDFIHNFISYDNDWKQIFEEEACDSGLSSYFTSSVSEYFAESFQLFYLEPEQLLKSAPNTYSFIQTFVKQYESY